MRDLHEAALRIAAIILADTISNTVQAVSGQLSWPSLFRQIGQSFFEIFLGPGLAERMFGSAVDVHLRTHRLRLCPGLIC